MLKKYYFLALVLFISFTYSQDKKAINSINKNEIESHLSFLASDALEGRLTPSPGLDIAAKYIADQFRSFGLNPIGDSGSYFQNFDVYCSDYPEHSLTYNGKTYDKTFQILPPITESIGTPSCEITGKLVFAGYGISDPENGYDEYPGVNVKDKIVVMLRGIPKIENKDLNFDIKTLLKWNLVKNKIEAAKKRGAIGILLVGSPNINNISLFDFAFLLEPYHKASLLKSKTAYESDLPIVVINEKVADQLLSASGKTLDQIKNSISKNLQPQSFDISDKSAELKIKKTVSTQNTKNVVGFLEGSDPKLKKEVVVIGGHYDHVGIMDGEIYNGSDDDASGTVGVIELAKAFSKSKEKPKRSILFITFTGEEQGLLGSTYYVSHSIYPLDKTYSMIQFDMIARDEDTMDDNPVGILMNVHLPKSSAKENTNSVYLYGLSFCKEMKDVFINANKNTHLVLKTDYDTTTLFQGSDHIPFFNKKIPVCFFNTGLHPDLHRPTDDVEKTDFPKMEKIIKFAYYGIWDLANRSGELKMSK